MPIETTTPGSPGWWMQHLAGRLVKQRERVDKLHDYAVGNPPLPQGADNARPAYAEFQRKARTNFAQLIIDALLDRMRVRTVRTAVDADDDGDAEAAKLLKANRFNLALNDAMRWSLTYGVSYLSVAGPEDGGSSVILPEHPSQFYAVTDPLNPTRTRAALKLWHDEVESVDYAYLWTPGKLDVARRPRTVFVGGNVYGPRVQPFIGSTGWEWDTERSAEFDDPTLLPVHVLENPNGMGEFEAHLDLLDRINHMLLQRMVIATFQAFRQRAVIQDLPDTDSAGEVIDYDAIFTSDPGALWRLPLGTTMWESAQADLTPILSSVRDDVLHLAAVTRTPLTMFTPDAATQTAEGASLQREGLTFKAKDRQDRFGEPVAGALADAFALQGDVQRADLAELEVEWEPAERFSLSEKASASAQATTSGVPWRARASLIWQQTPAEVERWEAMRVEDQALTPAVAANRVTNELTATNSSQRAVAGANVPRQQGDEAEVVDDEQ